MNKNPKVLVSAYACEPNKGSEPGVGWNWAKQIARFHEVWVITRENNREPIEKEIQKAPDSNMHFIYTDLPKWARFWKSGEKGVRLYYYLWQFAALKTAFLAHKKLSFDICHHITFVNNWQPALISLLPIPFIWGPIGSNPPVPNAFLTTTKLIIRDKLRLLVQNLFRYFDIFFYLTLFRAKKIILINGSILNRYPFSLISKNKFLIEQAIGIDIIAHSIKTNINNLIRIISVGQLIFLKGFHLAIEAFSRVQLKNPNMELVIVGNGPEEAKLKALATKEGVAHKVRFFGRISREDVLNELAKSDIFLFPSFEGGGMVVLEAMACGLPVVCLDFGGPGEMVTDKCGIKVIPITPEQTINDLSYALIKLADNPELRKKMGEAGKKRVLEHYTWEKKGEFIKEVYEKVLGGR